MPVLDMLTLTFCAVCASRRASGKSPTPATVQKISSHLAVNFTLPPLCESQSGDAAGMSFKPRLANDFPLQDKIKKLRRRHRLGQLRNLRVGQKMLFDLFVCRYTVGRKGGFCRAHRLQREYCSHESAPKLRNCV